MIAKDIRQQSFEKKHSFIYKSIEYPFNLDIFMLFSKYMKKNENEFKSQKKIKLIYDNDKTDFPEHSINSFIDFCQFISPIPINDQNVTHMYYLAMKYEVESLINETIIYMKNSKVKYALDIILYNQNIEVFDKGLYEDIISENLEKFIDDDKLLNIDLVTIHRIFSRYKLIHKDLDVNDEMEEKIIELKFKCLDKYGISASVLFNDVDFSKIKADYLNRLLTKYSDKFDFHYINSNLMKNIYEIQNDHIKNMNLNIEKNKNIMNAIKKETQLVFEHMKDDFNKIKMEFDQMKAENIKMQKQNEQMKNEFNQMKAENKQMQKQNEQMKNEIDQMKAENIEMQNQNEQLENEFNQMKTEKEQMQKQNEQMKNEIDQIKATNIQIKKEFNEYKNKVESSLKQVKENIQQQDKESQKNINNLINKSEDKLITEINIKEYNMKRIISQKTIKYEQIEKICQTISNSIDSLYMPNDITTINDKMFYRCLKLKTIIFPSSLKKIGNRSFFECTSLKEIKIPNSVNEIGEYAFFDCSSIISLVIPSSVTKIHEGCFKGCTSLNNITFSATLNAIESFTFASCTSLSRITIPNSVKKIEKYAFCGCSLLQNVSIHNSTKIEIDAFKECPNYSPFRRYSNFISVRNFRPNILQLKKSETF
ncbi:hypothetical protein M9Y10_021326 [Tritrichomonas musculus]|uniref:Uncharacterized protein n=1 Tax=Tritrichomonas musculus TaxID=1915356 RepID=A0ABR2HDN3_9EUKA